MIVRNWIEEFDQADVSRAALRSKIDLHVADTAIAFFAGRQAVEARALARYYGSREKVAGLSAIIRRTEVDDIHLASCVTPGSVVVPVALSLSYAADVPSERFYRAVLAGYAVGLRLGRAVGGTAALPSGIWPTYLAAPVMAAATAAVCLGLCPDQIASALGLAAAGTGGRAGRPAGVPSGRWLSLSESVAKGYRAAFAARDGFQGDPRLISADWLAAVADHRFTRPEALAEGTAEELIAQVGFKPFVSARQTTNAIVAFRRILERGIQPDAVSRVEVGVPTINAALVGRPMSHDDRLSIIADVRVQIAAAALRPALLDSTERESAAVADLLPFAERVSVVAAPDLDAFLPDSWAGRVKVRVDGQTIEEVCSSIPGDPGHRDSVCELLLRKLARLVPDHEDPTCAELVHPADKASRNVQRSRLWQAIELELNELAG